MPTLQLSPARLPETADALLHEDARWLLALRVTESPSFRNSRHLSQFLLFLCEHALSHPAEEITEQIIGEKVFRRRQGYSTGEDNIVRSYAHRLRSRLELYFREQGANEPIRIRIPKGTYVALFEENLPATGGEEPQKPQLLPHLQTSRDTSVPPSDESATALPEIVRLPAEGRGKWITFSSWQVCAIALLLLLAGVALGRRRVSGAAQSAPPSPAHPLWAQMFSGNGETFIVTADNGLGVLQDITGRYASLHNYIDGSYFAQFSRQETSAERTIYRLSRERLTSVPDSATAAAMLSLPEAKGHKVSLRNARDLRLVDLKQSNLVLLGSNYGDPWVTLFESSMNFSIDYHANGDTYASEIVNHNPKPGESHLLINSSTVPPYTTYAVVALLPNLDRTGWALLVEGLTMAGTQAAGDFVLHGNIDPLLREATKEGHLRPFEVVLKLTNLDSEASTPTVLMKRIY